MKIFNILAKKFGLNFDEISKENKRIIQEINKLEEFNHEIDEKQPPLTFIKKSKFFESFSKESESERLDAHANKILQKNMRKDDILFEIGDGFKGIFIVKSGLLSVLVGQKEQNLMIGDVLGLKELVDFLNIHICKLRKKGLKFKYTVRSVTDVELIFMEKDVILDLVRKNEKFFQSIYLMYYQRYVLKLCVSFISFEFGFFLIIFQVFLMMNKLIFFLKNIDEIEKTEGCEVVVYQSEDCFIIPEGKIGLIL